MQSAAWAVPAGGGRGGHVGFAFLAADALTTGSRVFIYIFIYFKKSMRRGNELRVWRGFMSDTVRSCVAPAVVSCCQFVGCFFLSVCVRAGAPTVVVTGTRCFFPPVSCLDFCTVDTVRYQGKKAKQINFESFFSPLVQKLIPCQFELWGVMIFKYYHLKLVISDQKLKDIFPADTQFYQIRKKIKEVCFFSSLSKMEWLSLCVCVNSQCNKCMWGIWRRMPPLPELKTQ